MTKKIPPGWFFKTREMKKRHLAKTDTEGYIATVESLEPDIHSIDAGAYYASAAISLKRIADQLGYIKVWIWVLGSILIWRLW